MAVAAGWRTGTAATDPFSHFLAVVLTIAWTRDFGTDCTRWKSTLVTLWLERKMTRHSPSVFGYVGECMSEH